MSTTLSDSERTRNGIRYAKTKEKTRNVLELYTNQVTTAKRVFKTRKIRVRVSENILPLASPIIHLPERIVSVLIAIPTQRRVLDSVTCHFLSIQTPIP